MKRIVLLVSILSIYILSFAQNPIIRDQFSADPSVRLFKGKIYLYPSHDIVAKEGQGRPGWFCMEDYHVFSSENLTDWVDHGVIVSQNNVEWVKSDSYSMWAPDCVEKNGKYYFYFPAGIKDTSTGRGFGVGVAVADNPEGPFIAEEKPIKNLRGIDPNIFIDKDGQAYICWSGGRIFIAKLSDNMLELSSDITVAAELPKKGLIEGPWMFERNGKYYMTYPHVENKIERLEYAMGDSPMGPFKFAGVIMDESPMNCWTNHHSFVEYKGQWYLFYHQNAYSPAFDKNRSVCIDSLFFNEDGTIKKVIPTHRGVGLTEASSEIQIDRYSSISEKGVEVIAIDTLDRFKGWKTVMSDNKAWINYNAVSFSDKKYTKLILKALSKEGSAIKVYTDSVNEENLISETTIPKSSEWSTVETKIKKNLTGKHDLIVELKGDKTVEIDWVRFEK